jgi:DNA polymerase-3 subunit delta
MKLAARDIASFLESPNRVCGALVYGPDLGLVRQRVNQIAAKILRDPNDPFNRMELTGTQIAEDPARLYDELSAMSFTGDTRLLLVRDAEESFAKALEPALDALTKQTYLLIAAGDLAARSALRALAEKHPQLAALPCYKDEGVGLESLIRETFTGYGIRAQPEVIKYLAASLGGDRMIIMSELEKISLYLGDSEEILTLETVMLLTGDMSDRGLDEMIQAVASGNIDVACRLLDKLFLEGVNAVPMVRALQRYFQRLQEIHQLAAERGGSFESVVDSLRPPVFFRLKPVLSAHAKRWGMAQISRAQTRLLDLEIEMKRHHDQQPPRFGQAMIGLARLAG